MIPRVLRTSSFRLAAFYAGLFAVSTGVLFALVYWIAGDVMREQARQSIVAEFVALAELSGQGQPPSPALLAEIGRRTADDGRRAFHYGLHDAQGRRLAGDVAAASAAGDWFTARLRETEEEAHEGERHDDHEVRLLALTRPLGDGVSLTVGLDVYGITEAQEAIVRAFGWAAGAGLFLALSGGLLLSHGFLRRVDEVNRATAAIIAGNLGERIRTDGSGDELDRLGRNLNTMLDRLQASMEGLKQVSNDIAHDLRTPLARVKQRLQAAQEEATSVSEYRSAVDDALAQTDTALATFGALLRIAQIESHSRKTRFRRLDLSALLTRLLTIYAPVAEDLGKSLAAQAEPDLAVLGDEELLVQLFVNLIENALGHTPPGARVDLILRREGREAVVEVRDDGPGIPVEEREKVFRRFYRLDRSRTTAGSGLGMALVAAVASLHGVPVHLDDNGPGLVVRLRFALLAGP